MAGARGFRNSNGMTDRMVTKAWGFGNPSGSVDHRVMLLSDSQLNKIFQCALLDNKFYIIGNIPEGCPHSKYEKSVFHLIL